MNSYQIVFKRPCLGYHTRCGIPIYRTWLQYLELLVNDETIKHKIDRLNRNWFQLQLCHSLPQNKIITSVLLSVNFY